MIRFSRIMKNKVSPFCQVLTHDVDEDLLFNFTFRLYLM